MERSMGEELEPMSYVIPTITANEASPFIRLEDKCSDAIKDIVAQANKVLENVSGRSNPVELKELVQRRLEQTKEKIFVQVKMEDQDRDKRLSAKEIRRLCAEEGVADTYTGFRFNVAVKNAKLSKSIVVRVNPRSEEAFVWQQPNEGQTQVEAKILIVQGSHQREVVGRLFEKGERTDGLTAGRRGG